MSIKLLLLKSGEDVVADVQEMMVEEKVVGYLLKYPCSVKLVGGSPQDGEGAQPFKIQLTPWTPLSKDTTVPVVADWVVTMTQPIDQLKNMFEQGVAKYEKPADSDSSDGEGDSDSD